MEGTLHKRNTRRLLPIVLLAGLAALAAAPCSAAVIRLHAQAEAQGSVVRLGDVAEILDVDGAIVSRLGSVLLGPAPAQGRSVSFDFEAIRGRLTAQGFSLAALEFSGTSHVTVSSGKPRGEGSGAAPASDLAHRQAETLVSKAVARFVREQNREAGHVSVELKLPAEHAALVSQSSSSRLEVRGGRTPFLGEQQFRIEFHDRQGQAQRFEAECRVVPQPRVLVPKSGLAKGHVLRAEDLDFKQLDANVAHATYFEAVERLVGQETRRSLRAGEPIAATDVRGVPLIRRGDIVTVSARTRGVVVRMEAKAQGDGSLGDAVKLLSLDGRRELTARVSGFHEATVTPAGATAAAAPSTPGTGVRLVPAEAPRGMTRLR